MKSVFSTVATAALCLASACGLAQPLAAQSQGINGLHAIGDRLPRGATARIGTTRFRSPAIETIAYSPDGRTLAAGSADGTVRLFDSVTGRVSKSFTHKNVAVVSLSFSADGRWLASAGDSTEQPAKELVVWSVANGAIVHSAEMNRGFGRVAFSADGKWLAGAGSSGKIVVWGTDSWDEFVAVEPRIGWLHDFCFAPDNRTLVYSSRRGYQTRDILTGQPSALIQHRPSDFIALAVAPDCRHLAVGSSDESALIIRDLTNHAETRRLKDFARTIGALAYSPDGTLLATAEQGTADAVRLWDPRTGEERGVFSAPVASGGFRCVRLAPDGQTLAAVYRPGGVIVCNVASGQRVFANDGHDAPLRALAISADGSTLVSGDDCGTIQVRDRGTGKVWQTLLLPWSVLALSASADGRYVAGGVYFERFEDHEFRSDRFVAVWDTVAGRELFRVDDADECMTLSADGRSLLARASNDIVERATSTGQEVKRYRGRAAPSRCALSRDGRSLAIARGDGESVTLLNRSDGTVVKVLSGNGSAGLAFLAGDRLLLGVQPGKVTIWDTTSGGQFQALAHPEIRWAAASPDGRYVVTGQPKQESMLVWELASGHPCLELAGHLDGTRAAAFADGRTLVSAGRDTTLLYWDICNPRFAGKQGTPLSAEDRLALYQRLASADASNAHRAAVALIQDGAPSVDLLATYLGVSRGRDMDESTQTSAPLPAEDLRHLRAIAVLERIGSPAAKRILFTLAGGASEARRTLEAKAALRRLG